MTFCKITDSHGGDALKTIVETVSSQMSHISFTINHNTLLISGVDMAHVSIVQIALLSSSFSTFQKKGEQDIHFHVSISHLKRILRGCKSDDSFSMSLKNENDTYVRIQFENEFRSVSFRLPMLEIDQDVIEVPDLEYETTINIPACKFQSVFNDLNVLSPETVCIRSCEDEIVISSDEHGSEVDMCVPASEDVKIDWTENVTVQVSLDKLIAYSGMSKLSDQVHMHLSCDFPVYVHFPLIRLVTNNGKKEKNPIGTCKCHIAPRTNE